MTEDAKPNQAKPKENAGVSVMVMTALAPWRRLGVMWVARPR
jgi:hypothetical protein